MSLFYYVRSRYEYYRWKRRPATSVIDGLLIECDVATTEKGSLKLEDAIGEA
jgi:hypothetical protein